MSTSHPFAPGAIQGPFRPSRPSLRSRVAGAAFAIFLGASSAFLLLAYL